MGILDFSWATGILALMTYYYAFKIWNFAIAFPMHGRDMAAKEKAQVKIFLQFFLPTELHAAIFVSKVLTYTEN